MPELLFALGQGDDAVSFMDLRTGQITTIARGLGLHEEQELEQLECSDDHAAVPHVRDEYEWMEAFAEAVDDERARERLFDALRGRGAFRRFKDMAAQVGRLDAWFAFRDERRLAIALEWLKELEIEPVYTMPKRAPAPEPAPPREPSVDLLDAMLLGAPEGGTELRDGRVARVVHLASADVARRAFHDLARQCCALEGVEWRKRFTQKTDRFDLGRMHLRVEGERVWIEIEVKDASRYRNA